MTTTTAGRPRSAELTEKLLRTAAELFGDKGFGPVTMAEIAAAAGVGLDTIYRRWPSKQRLLLDIVSAGADDLVPIEDRGSLEADLVAAVAGLIRLAKSADGRVLAAAIGEAAHDPELAAQLAQAQGRRRERAMEMVRRAEQRGELQDGADADLLLDLLSGVIWQRSFVTGHTFAPDEPVRIVRSVLAGFVR